MYLHRLGEPVANICDRSSLGCNKCTRVIWKGEVSVIFLSVLAEEVEPSACRASFGCDLQPCTQYHCFSLANMWRFLFVSNTDVLLLNVLTKLWIEDFAGISTPGSFCGILFNIQYTSCSIAFYATFVHTNALFYCMLTCSLILTRSTPGNVSHR